MKNLDLNGLGVQDMDAEEMSGLEGGSQFRFYQPPRITAQQWRDAGDWICGFANGFLGI